MTSIGEVAAELGLSVETLRYYERAGLSAPARDSGGRRAYSEHDVGQLRLVTTLRHTGVPVDAIRQLLTAKVAGDTARANAERALDRLAAIDAVLADRQAQVGAAREVIRGWAEEIGCWLAAERSTVGPGDPSANGKRRPVSGSRRSEAAHERPRTGSLPG